MEFEIVNYSEVDSQDESNTESCVIKAHRVVVASSCDWFRKALLSGMKEDIDKLVQVPIFPRFFKADNSIYLFLFLARNGSSKLHFLYTAAKSLSRPFELSIIQPLFPFQF